MTELWAEVSLQSILPISMESERGDLALMLDS